MRKKFKNILLVLVGSGLLGAGIVWFADPLGLVIGGVSGIGILLSRVSEMLFGFALPLGPLNLLLNIPIFVAAWIQRGRKFVQQSLFGMLALSGWMALWQLLPMPSVREDMLVGGLLCGVLSGVGLALVLQAGATTGGTDMLAAILHRFLAHISLSILIFAVDAVIIAAGLFVFGLDRTCYAVVSVWVTSRLMDAILSGGKFARAVWIISSENDAISDAVFRKLQRGNTCLSGRGMYTGQERDMLFIVVSPKELPALKEIIHAIDPDAFVTVCPAQEVLGEGFSDPKEIPRPPKGR